MRPTRGSKLAEHDYTSLGPVLEFMRVVWEVDHALQRASKQMEATIGVTGPQRLVIRIVGRFPGIRAGQLSTLLHIHPSTLTGILKRLERQGLVRRSPDPSDARRSLLGLTSPARLLDVARDGTIESTIAEVLEYMPAKKLAAAREVLGEMAQRLSSSLDQPQEVTLRSRKRKSSASRQRRAK
jgi:DNA-binding MarR family transcriptional regulator